MKHRVQDTGTAPGGCPDLRPEILYEDNHILVAVKPPGTLSQEDATHAPDMLTSLHRMISERLGGGRRAYVALVHRLDRPASGLMLFARSSKAASRLSDAFRAREIKKEYLARVRGIPEEAGFFCDLLSKTTDADGQVRVLTEDHPVGRKEGWAAAELSWRRISADRERGEALILISLVTGRKHQIRAQFAAHGFPLLGDRRYGCQDARDSEVPTAALHACRLSFVHPVRKTEMVFSCGPAVNPSFGEEDALLFQKMLDKDTSVSL